MDNKFEQKRKKRYLREIDIQGRMVESCKKRMGIHDVNKQTYLKIIEMVYYVYNPKNV